eukprot:12733-Heterococcus_DN1.PRE.3
MPNSLVPALFLRPNALNQLPPLLRIVGATAIVSTFVTVVGQPKTPTFAGKGGCCQDVEGVAVSSSASPTALVCFAQSNAHAGTITDVQASTSAVVATNYL